MAIGEATYRRRTGVRVKSVRGIYETLLDMPRKLTKKRALLACATFAFLTVFYGWKFATLVMTFVYVHESGHLWAAKTLGLKTDGFLFLPIGGMAMLKQPTRSHYEEVYVAIMGPVWGLALAALSAGVYYATGRPFFAAAALIMCVINVFNLLPIHPLDGGRVAKSIAYSRSRMTGYRTLIAGIVLAVILFFITWSFILLLVAAVSFLSLKAEHKNRRILPKMSKKYIVRSLIYTLSTIAAFVLLGILMLNSLGEANPMDLLLT